MNVSIVAKHPGVCRSHPYQDKRYGVGMRLMTEGGGREAPVYRCTVCGKPGLKARTQKRPGWPLSELKEVRNAG